MSSLWLRKTFFPHGYEESILHEKVYKWTQLPDEWGVIREEPDSWLISLWYNEKRYTLCTVLLNMTTSRDCQLESTTYTCYMQTNCGRGSLTTWRKRNTMYLIMLSTKRNVTLLTLSFKSFHLKTCRLAWFPSPIKEDDLKRCNKIFLIQTAINILLGIVNQIPPAFVIRCVLRVKHIDCTCFK